jgi:hypothetical protein
MAIGSLRESISLSLMHGVLIATQNMDLTKSSIFIYNINICTAENVVS